jgi:signal transduction histidine kinase
MSVSAASPDPLPHRVLRWSALLLLGVAHAGHDMLDGDPLLPALLPTLGFAVEVVLLSYGQKLAERRQWSATSKVLATVLASLLGGLLIVALHADRTSNRTGIFVASAAAGGGVFAFWRLVFYFPTQLGRARLRALAAENERRKAELERLRANLHPHFLLNTLNAVAGLLVVEPTHARQLVVALGDLLRDSLEDEGAMRALGDEVEWLRRYAQIFEIRHRGAIQFQWDLAADSLTVPLPRLLLQPLLENAIKHGALRRPGGGTVTLRSRTVDGSVSITVADDGPGMPANRPAGLGLRLVQDRLQLAYPSATLTIDASSAGTQVTLGKLAPAHKTETA